MKKFNLIGNTFTHLSGGNKGYSVHGKTSKYIEWVQDGSGIGTFYVDTAIREALLSMLPGPKYLWLLESKWIDGAKEHLLAGLNTYLDLAEMIFTHDQELIKLDSKFKFVPAQGSWIISPSYNHPKYKNISMVSSNKNWCAGHIERLAWVEKLRGIVDLYGRGFNEIPMKESALMPYMFSVAIENGQYETYFTEKILDCFLCGTIPVYIGAPDIGNYFNMDGIILLNDDLDFSTLNSDLWWSKYDAIKDNFKRALKMEVLEDYIWENYLIEIGDESEL